MLRIANGTGNFGTAGSWGQIANTPTLHASTNIVASVAGALSAAFTAPNTSNAVTGCALYLTAKGTATTLTATLQEATVDTAHTVTINLADVELGWIYLRPNTPYVYTAVTANRYRWRISVDSGTTTTVAQASTANPAFLSSDNRTGVPGSGDNAFIIGINGGTAVSITMNGTQTVGTNSGAASSRAINNALIIGNGGALQLDTAASSQLTHTGFIAVDNKGEFSCGTTGSPLSASYTAEVICGFNGQGIWFGAGSKNILQGAPKAYYKTTYSSGLGTAASPLITADPVDWNVGDQIIVGASSNSGTNYNETEVKFIITKNSSTSFVLSDTSGGSENALLYTHANAPIGNFKMNIIIRGASTAVPTIYATAAQAVPGLVDIDWVRFENLNPGSFLGAVPTDAIMINANCDIDYCVAVNGAAGLFILNTQIPGTNTGLMAYNTLTTVGLKGVFANIVLNSCKDRTLAGCVSFASKGFGIGMISSSCILEDSIALACNNAGANAGNIHVSGGQIQLINVKSNASRGAGLYLDGGASNTFIECEFGTEGTNARDIYTSTGAITALFARCHFGSADMIQNYLNMTLGSEVRFDTMNGVDNNHAWYTIYGRGVAELSVIRSPGLAVKIIPENLTLGFSWIFKTPVVPNSIAAFRGFFLKNPTLGSAVVTVSMYLPGNPVSSGVPDASQTLTNVTGTTFTDDDEQSVSLNTDYSGDLPGAATIVVNVKSNTPGAALYCDDFYNAGDRTTTYDPIAGLNLWTDGKPLEVIMPSVPSADDTAAAVWSALLSSFSIPGTAGKQLRDLLTTDDFIALK